MPSRPVALGVFALALAAVLILPGCSRPATNNDPSAYALIEAIGQAEMHRSPERAASVGIPPEMFGKPYDSLLDDRSIAAAERAKTERLEFLDNLGKLDRATLSRDALREVDAAAFLLDTASRLGRYGYGYANLGWAGPYVISQSDGAYQDLVKLLTTRVHVRSRAEAEAWLTRLRGAGASIDDERRRFEADRDLGVTPPRAILQRALDKARSLQVDDPKMHPLVVYFAEQLSQIADLPEGDIAKLTDEAAGAVKDKLRPANGRLIADLDKALKTASEDPGVWRLPKGDQYYQDAVRLFTSTDMTPEMVNAIGRTQVEAITKEMDVELAALGKSQGAVGERMAALAMDPANLYPNTPDGQAALVAAIGEQMKWAETNLSKMLTIGPQKQVEVRQAPEISQDTAPAGYYRAAAIDGSRPATFNVNLKNTALLPIWALPTLTFHEAVPGHHVQTAIARDRANVPPLFLLASFSGFSEGWGVYSEDLAAEMGAYKDNPLGRLGYLQSLLFRAARLVADTGIHHDRWSRQQAVDYMVQTTGMARAQMENEVDRYTIWPGQACAYMIGREKLQALRKQADQELGPSFDLKTFHDVLLAGGSRPLGVAETDIRDWITARRPAKSAQPSAPASVRPAQPAG